MKSWTIFRTGYVDQMLRLSKQVKHKSINYQKRTRDLFMHSRQCFHKIKVLISSRDQCVQKYAIEEQKEP